MSSHPVGYETPNAALEALLGKSYWNLPAHGWTIDDGDHKVAKGLIIFVRGRERVTVEQSEFGWSATELATCHKRTDGG